MRQWETVILLSALCAAGVFACTGVVGGAADEKPTAPTADEPKAPLAPAAVPSPSDQLRRLTNREYARTVADVFGETPEAAAALIPNSFLDGYDNNVLTLSVSGPVIEAYATAATIVARATLASGARRARAIGCDDIGPGRVACLSSVVDTLGRRAFRRPVTAEEREGLLALANAAASEDAPGASLQVLLEGILQSPSFLYRVEVGEPISDRPGLARLTGFEVATRLSYLFLGTTPDDALLDRAARGELGGDAGIEAEAQRMLADPRAKEVLATFHSQWLGLQKIESLERSLDAFPSWSGSLKTAMVEETRRFVDDFIWKDGTPFLDLLTARYTYVNAELAALYGVPAPAGEPFVRVDFSPSDPRGGILTHASILNATAPSRTLMGILRGKFVRDTFTCESLSPPAGVALDPTVERLKTPACAGCHEYLDPIASGFDRFDMVGVYRTTDETGVPLAGTGRIVGFEEPDFTGPLELAAKLRSSPKVSACVVEQFLRFATGRAHDSADRSVIASLDSTFRGSQFNFRHLLVELVKSDFYRTLRIGTEAGR